MRYFFEDYALDTDRCELRRGGCVLPVEAKVFDLLVHLIGKYIESGLPPSAAETAARASLSKFVRGDQRWAT